MSTLALPGIFSGVDTDTLIARIMAINARPITLQELRKEEWQDKVDAVDTIAIQLGYLKNIAEALRDADSLVSMSASSSDTDILGAVASKGAVEGSHEVDINQLARSHRLVHDLGVEAATTTVGASRSNARDDNGMANADAVWFTTTANGATYTFDFGTETDMDEVVFAASTGYSLNQVRDLINVRSQAVAGYDAAAVVEDSGTYYLELTAEDPGPVGTLTQTLTDGDAIAELNDEADWTKTDGQTGAFQYTYDGVTRTINTGTGTTLSDLVDLINDDAENPGVSASILNYEKDANHVYHLVLSGRDSGEGHEITIGAGTTLLGFESGGNWTVAQTAQNAQIRVDGYPSSDWIERESNSITDVIPNVTLTLKNTTGVGETVTVGLTRMAGTITADVNSLVSTYNDLVDVMDGYVGYDAENETPGVLQGTYSLPNLLTQVRIALSGTAAGFKAGTDPYTMLMDIGVHFDSEGKLKVDSSDLADAIENDYYGVISLIGALATGTSDDDYIQFSSAEETTEPGIYEVEIGFDGSGNIVQALIRTKGDSVWRNATWEGNTVYAGEEEPEEGLVLTATWDGASSTQEAEVRVLRGFGGMVYELVNAALDDETGTVTATKEGFQDQIEALEDNIETQTQRLEREEETLRARFARLEARLAQLDAQRGAFEAMLSALTAINNWGT